MFFSIVSITQHDQGPSIVYYDLRLSFTMLVQNLTALLLFVL